MIFNCLQNQATYGLLCDPVESH